MLFDEIDLGLVRIDKLRRIQIETERIGGNCFRDAADARGSRIYDDGVGTNRVESSMIHDRYTSLQNVTMGIFHFNW